MIREAQFAPPIQFGALAGIQRQRYIRLIVGGSLACIGDGERLVQKAIEQDQVTEGATVVLVGIYSAALRGREARECAEIIASHAQMTVAESRHEANIQITENVVAELRGGREI